MNGPEHYAEAERLLEQAHVKVAGAREKAIPKGSAYVAAAQVHATLALVAATLDAPTHNTGNTPKRDDEWKQALS